MAVAADYTPLDVPASGTTPFTDLTRWRLLVNDGGRHTWQYMRTDEQAANWPQSEVDRYWLGIPLNLPTLPKPKTPLEAARNGYTFYKHLQSPDGHWAGEYGGPMFILPGLVISSYITGMPFTREERLEMIRYLFNRAHPEDGGWGIHIEGHSTVFGTALNYVSLRILGVDAEHPVCIKARAHLHKLGGATGIPAWGKFWLSVLGVYSWEGMNPVPPELWLLPNFLPFHPHRWWIHTRQVYLPMSYIYASSHTHPLNPLTLSLRSELYTQPYQTIHWPSQRNNIASVDVYTPHTHLLDVMNKLLGVWELVSPLVPFVRKQAMDIAYQHVVYEDENTSYQCLAPVNKMMNQIVRFLVDGPSSHAYEMHSLRRRDFMWMGEEGLRVTGTNGSQLWDLSFIMQGIVESGLEGKEREGDMDSVRRALGWLDGGQILDDPKWYEVAYRHTTKGAWGFSTREQGYTVSDCTGEGLKAVLYLQNQVEGIPQLISDRRLCDAVDVLLTMQNPSGGFASYELIRGPRWLEWINPAEVFGDIMIEYAYPECTTSTITALSIFRKYYPDYRAAEIDLTITHAITYLHSVQQPSGGWVGCWGICFTYATQFALESLSLVGETYETSKSARRACEFLVGKQRGDGGWGESYKSCEQSAWVEHEETQIVQTCWAVMALIYARYPERGPIERGVRLVMGRQLDDGSWPQEAIEGVFNKNCMISYPNFKFSFSIWMLGRADKYLRELDAAGSS
ncbi:terpenoid cyclases/protein prenyltransferase alpha-alpha toroid [Pterulicium gracile]|uniref:Terpene cyclase/mutase family member n=1 Tax=Pterulicium gracile TaxID=1884261 RepID=A0A5C3Q8Z9_9AGAR|nr:terpenoid cyclases/protein prenyltransferase alpha-alpha toroid [Pterula gracilis]